MLSMQSGTLAGTRSRQWLSGTVTHAVAAAALLALPAAHPRDRWERAANQRLLTTRPYVEVRVAEPGQPGLQGDPVVWRLPYRTAADLRNAPEATWLVLVRLSGETEVHGDRAAMRRELWDQLDYCLSRGEMRLQLTNARYVTRPAPPAPDDGPLWATFENVTPPAEQWDVTVHLRAGTVEVTGPGTPPASALAFWRDAVAWRPDCAARESRPARVADGGTMSRQNVLPPLDPVIRPTP